MFSDALTKDCATYFEDSDLVQIGLWKGLRGRLLGQSWRQLLQVKFDVGLNPFLPASFIFLSTF